MQNSKRGNCWTWYEALGMWDLTSLFKEDQCLTLIYLLSRSNLLLLHLNGNSFEKLILSKLLKPMSLISLDILYLMR